MNFACHCIPMQEYKAREAVVRQFIRKSRCLDSSDQIFHDPCSTDTYLALSPYDVRTVRGVSASSIIKFCQQDKLMNERRSSQARTKLCKPCPEWTALSSIHNTASFHSMQVAQLSYVYAKFGSVLVYKRSSRGEAMISAVERRRYMSCSSWPTIR